MNTMRSPKISRSISAVERANPPPRKKSCDACIKAKRRCDHGHPACGRCAQRDIHCVYPSGRSQSRCHQRPNPDTCSVSRLETTPAFPPTSRVLGTVEELSTVWNGEFPINIDIPDWASFSPDASIDLFGITRDGLSESFGEIFPGGANKLDSVAMVLSLSSMCPRLVKHSQSSISTIIAARFQYAIDEIMRAPTRMVLETTTPWCHPQLFGAYMPRSILDAHSACALYLAKNITNAQVIMRSIEARVADLLASPSPTSSMEMLAQVQSLLLYQIIRVFDTDFRSYTSVDATTLALEKATLSLLSHLSSEQLSLSAEYTSIETLSLYPTEETRAFWASWIFMESARRTLMIALFFMQLHRVVSGNLPLYFDGILHVCNSWTLSAHLWDAENLFDFVVAWRERKHFVVKDGIFSEVISDAKPEDIGQFGKLLLTLLMGIDDTRAWFVARGSTL